MRNEENIGRTARGKHMEFSLLLMGELSIAC